MPTHPQKSALTRFLTRARGTSGRWAQLVDSNRQLLRTRDELLEAHRAKSAFLASLSHQLRTPLNTILLCSELLADDLAERGLDALSGDLENIQGAGRHLLDDIIDLTRLEAGRMVFQQEDTDLPALVRKLTRSFQPLALKHGNTLKVLDTALRTLSTDPGKLEQILFHLLDNALKFTRNGQVTLHLRPVEGGRWILFSVSDTGAGMSAEQVERIRLDFAQTPLSHPQSFGTAGLGLTLCRRLAEGLGGSLQVESQEGLGATFSLRIPFTR